MRFLYAFIPILLISSDRAASNEIGHYDILMLGNSYTSRNNGIDYHLNSLFGEASGISGQCGKLTGGGMKLSQHALNWGGSVLDTNTYDFIILQDQSQVPSFPPSGASYLASRDGAIVLDERVEKAGAETIFFLTWGYRYGDQRNLWNSPDYPSMQRNLEEGYRGYADAITDGTRKPYIAPVGLAFQKIYDDIVAEGGTPTDGGTLFASLYTGDNSHPSQYGAYLASCVIFSTITGISTIGMPDNFGIDDNTRLQLQEAADWSVFDDKMLGYEYPWESSNVQPPVQSEFPTETPATAPSGAPTETPSTAPTKTKSAAPTETASTPPTETPSVAPSTAPTKTKSAVPTESKSVAPTETPSTASSTAPTGTPSAVPTETKSSPPTETPSTASSTAPTETASTAPTEIQSAVPTGITTTIPFLPPSMAPSVIPAPSQGPSIPNDSGTTKATMFRRYNKIFLFGIPLLIALLT